VVIERLIIEPSETLHHERLAHRAHAEPLRGGDRGLAEFAKIRAIQEHLVDAAKREGVPLVDPDGLGELTQSIVDEIVQATRADPDVAG
jgi:2-phosphoglycerate kinase